MKSGVYVAIGVVIAALTFTFLSAAQDQKPKKHRTVHLDGGIGAPPTIEQLWSMSPLIVDATIVADRPLDRKIGPPSFEILIQTAYKLHVNEVFRDVAHVAHNGTLEFVQRGGDRDKGDYIDSVDELGFARLEKGERYALFLKPSRFDAGTYVTATDSPDSAILLAEDGRAVARGRSDLAQRLDRYSREELLTTLRNLKERQP